MGKSLAELEAAFQAQYPKGSTQEKNKKKKEKIKKTKVETEAVATEAVEMVGIDATETDAVTTDAVATKVEIMQPAYEEEDRPRTSIFVNLIFYFALIASLFCIILFLGGFLKDRAIGGIRLAEMSTPSMVGVYPEGSLLVVKELPMDELKVGDDISFYQNSESISTHRIAEVIEDYEETGKQAFITRGVSDPSDEEEVLAIQIVGRVDNSVPQIGVALSWTNGNMHYIVLAFLVLIVIMVFTRALGRRSY